MTKLNAIGVIYRVCNKYLDLFYTQVSDTEYIKTCSEIKQALKVLAKKPKKMLRK